MRNHTIKYKHHHLAGLWSNSINPLLYKHYGLLNQIEHEIKSM